MGITGAIIAAGSAQAGGVIFETLQSNQNIEDQQKFQSQQLKFNKRLADMDAEDAIRRGEKSVEQAEREVEQFEASQKAQLAARGIDTTQGVGASILDETANLAAEERETIRTNAFREAFGFKTESLNLETAERLGKFGRRQKQRQTLITGGIKVANVAGQTAMAAGGGGAA